MRPILKAPLARYALLYNGPLAITNRDCIVKGQWRTSRIGQNDNVPCSHWKRPGNDSWLLGAMCTEYVSKCGMKNIVTMLTLDSSPHIHPRSAELFAMVAGDTINTGTFQENGARFVTNKLEVGQATVFPMGSVHFQQNLGCDPAIFVAGFANEDPGTLQVAQGFFQELPPDTVSATLGELGVEEVTEIAKQIPANIAFGVEECVKRCNIDRNSTFVFSEDVIKKALKEQGVLATIASGAAASRASAATSGNIGASNNLGASSTLTAEAGNDDNNNDAADEPFSKNKYHILVIVLGAACAALLIALIFAIVIATRARRAARARGHSPVTVPLFTATGHGKSSGYATPYETEKYADGGRIESPRPHSH